MTNRLGFDDGSLEREYAGIVFLCMVCSIVVGVPSASWWVSMFGRVPLGIEAVSPVKMTLVSK